MIIGLFGRSATGKTTLASRAGTALSLDVRHCGQIIKQRALARNCSIDDAPDELHHEVDAETVEWTLARKNGGCIVEGRFLNQVLASLRSEIHLVEVIASNEARLARWRERTGSNFSADHLVVLDNADDFFRRRMYDSLTMIVADASIDTTRGAAGGWENMIESFKERQS